MATSLLQDLLNALTRRDFRDRMPHPGIDGRPATAQELQLACEDLLASDGEASSIGLARQVLDLYVTLEPEEVGAFFHLLLEAFGPDRAAVDTAYEAYKQTGSELSLSQLFDACEPRRQALLRRLNLAPGGTLDLVRMREDLLKRLREEEALVPVDRDFSHLLSSWFNRGFLVLRRIEWQTPASILEKIIKYESVHAISDWNDLRRRLDPRDRRCFGFFHPALGDEPLVFVEVALTSDIPRDVQDIIHAEETPANLDAPTTAAFFGISNCQYGLRGISFGNFLIKQVVQELKQECPSLETFVTLSPLPSFRAWLDAVHHDAVDYLRLPDAWRETLALADAPDWHRQPESVAALEPVVVALVAHYLCETRNAEGYPQDPVARFHLGNGARLERINWLGDVSDKGLHQSLGIMVNYVYAIDEIENNHERYVNEGHVAASRGVRKVAKAAADGLKEKKQ
jgi:malonyl-CoA decarboxylase